MIQGMRTLEELRLRDDSQSSKHGGFTNPRTFSGLEREQIRELAASIATHGLTSPLVITETGLVIAGQRRTLALRLLAAWVEREHRRITCIPVNPAWARDSSLEDLDALIEDAAQRSLWVDRCKELRNIPVHIVDRNADIEGLALVDNLHRSEMSSYEIAARLAHLHETAGATGVNLARAVGRSKSWVSRKLKAWQGACAELREAWKAGMAEETVLEMVELAPDAQRKVLARGPRSVRGPANRPAIRTVKASLAALERRWTHGAHGRRPIADSASPEAMHYAKGIRDALRWIAGHTASEELLEVINEGDRTE